MMAWLDGLSAWAALTCIVRAWDETTSPGAIGVRAVSGTRSAPPPRVQCM